MRYQNLLLLLSAITLILSGCEAVGTPYQSPTPTPIPDASNWSDLGAAGFSVAGANSMALAVDSAGEVWAAYSDANAANKATVQRFDGVDWVLVGAAGFTPATATPSLVFDSSDTAFVLYKDSSNANHMSAMKFNGTAWEQAGDPGFSTGPFDGFEVAFVAGESGLLYAAFGMEVGGNTRTEVYQFDGTDWSALTPATAFNTLTIQSPSALAVDNAGIPYLVASDSSVAGKATVMKYSGTGTTWELVGPAGFTPADTWMPAITIDSAGRPYVAHVKDSTQIEPKIAVLRFNGGAWEQVGVDGFSAPIVEQPTIVIDSSGTPFVSYTNTTNFASYTMQIMRFSGTAWVPAGPNGNVNISAAAVNAFETALVAGPSRTIYAGFSDKSNGDKATVKVLSP